MTKINRRSMLGLLGSAPLAAGFTWTDAEAAQRGAGRAGGAARRAAQAGLFKPKFFTAHEYATVRVLVDLIIPKDARSGSATDAGVPEFMDFMMVDEPARQTPMRGGLAWIDLECQDRFDKRFLDVHAPSSAPPSSTTSPGRRRRSRNSRTASRSSTASATSPPPGSGRARWASTDLKYMGNVVVPEWKGCPDEALKRLGVDARTRQR